MLLTAYLDVGDVIYARGGLWRIVQVHNGQVFDAIAHPEPLVWAAPKRFHTDEVGRADGRI